MITLTCLIAGLFGMYTQTNLIQQTASLFKVVLHPSVENCIRSFSSDPSEVFTILYEDLNADKKDDAFVQYTEGDACGSAGCVFELCMNTGASFTYIPFGIAGSEITVMQTMTNGMRDIEIKNTDQKDQRFRLYWNGTTYDLERE